MKLRVSKMKVWSTDLKDQPGAAARKLESLARAGADLKFLLGRRLQKSPGKGVLFVYPIIGKKQEAAARNTDFRVRMDIGGVCVEGNNKSGAGFQMTQALGQAGINLRAVCASVIGKKFVAFFATDSSADADKAMKILKRM